MVYNSSKLCYYGALIYFGKTMVLWKKNYGTNEKNYGTMEKKLWYYTENYETNI